MLFWLLWRLLLLRTMNDRHLEGPQLSLDYADIAETLTTLLFSHALIPTCQMLFRLEPMF